MTPSAGAGRVVPTLTEVLTELDLGVDTNPMAPVVESVMIDLTMPPGLSVSPPSTSSPDPQVPVPPGEAPAHHSADEALEAKITQQVLVDVQRQVDLMLEYRLREALAPSLARVCDLLIREARQELALTLRDVVGRAVAQELARQRSR